MKPEKSLLTALICTFCVLLYQRFCKNGINLYNILVVFSVIYVVSAYVPIRSFFKKESPKEKENHTDTFQK